MMTGHASGLRSKTAAPRDSESDSTRLLHTLHRIRNYHTTDLHTTVMNHKLTCRQVSASQQPT